MKFYFLNAEDALVRLTQFIICKSPVPTSPRISTFEGDYVPPPQASLPNQFSLIYKTLPPTSPFRVVGEDFTFYDCEIVNIQPIEHTITGLIGNPQITDEVQREAVTKMMKVADEL